MNLKALLVEMTERKASDLFITAGLPPSIKVHGEIRPCMAKIMQNEEVEAMVFSSMNEHQKAEFIATNECQYAIGSPEIGRFRVSAFVQQGNKGMVIRRIETNIPTPESLQLPEILKTLICAKRGIILFAGATGTGKSTTLAALIGHRNRTTSGHIITIEDPIEYVHQHAGCIITQREVGVDTESFEVALKATLRQAPDVILIGEIRSEESMRYALSFAETGHLVLATIHANNANQALDRIIHFFPHDIHEQVWADLSLNMKAIVAQQLIQKVDKKGRCLAVEIMVNTPLCADHVRRGEVHLIKQLMARSTEQGMQTFDQALYALFSQGQISYEDALRHSDSPNNLRLMIKMDVLPGDQEMDNVLKDLKIAEEDLSENLRKEIRPSASSMFDTKANKYMSAGRDKTADHQEKTSSTAQPSVAHHTTSSGVHPPSSGLSKFFGQKKTTFSDQKKDDSLNESFLSIKDKDLPAKEKDPKKPD